MVLAGDFQIALVNAETKIPFQEHSFNGKTYFEVEPDLDYWIAIKKISKNEDKMYQIVTYHVDEKDLGYHSKYKPRQVDSEYGYKGTYKRERNVQEMTALRFVRPKVSDEIDAKTANLMMGKIEVCVHEGKDAGVGIRKESSRGNDVCEAPSCSLTVVKKKKNLRTGKGTAIECKQVSMGQRTKRKRGSLLHTVTFHYCTALGLIEVGALPKPDDVWTYHRMKHPAKRMKIEGGSDNRTGDVISVNLTESTTVDLTA